MILVTAATRFMNKNFIWDCLAQFTKEVASFNVQIIQALVKDWFGAVYIFPGYIWCMSK